jgi:uncharacterized protein (DUF433 family)
MSTATSCIGWTELNRQKFKRQVLSVTTTDRIEINPELMMGKPVIRGTRITVELIVQKIKEGASEEEVLKAYPKLSKKDIRAAIEYASNMG